MTESDSKKSLSLQFDKTVSLGHIITVVPLVGALVVAYASYREAHRDHESRITVLERQYHSLADQMKTMWEIKENVAVIKDRLERISPASAPGR